MRKLTGNDLNLLYNNLKIIGISNDSKANNLYQYLMDEIIPLYMNNKYHLLDAKHLLKRINLATRIYQSIPPYRYGLNPKCLLVLVAFEDISMVLDKDTTSRNRFKKSSQIVKEKYSSNLKYILETWELDWLYNAIEYPKNQIYDLKKIYSNYYESLYSNFANDIRRISLLPYDYAISNIYHDLCVKNNMRSVKYNMFETWVKLHNIFNYPLAIKEIFHFENTETMITEMKMLLRETKENKDLSNYI